MARGWRVRRLGVQELFQIELEPGQDVLGDLNVSRRKAIENGPVEVPAHGRHHLGRRPSLVGDEDPGRTTVRRVRSPRDKPAVFEPVEQPPQSDLPDIKAFREVRRHHAGLAASPRKVGQDPPLRPRNAVGLQRLIEKGATQPRDVVDKEADPEGRFVLIVRLIWSLWLADGKPRSLHGSRLSGPTD